MKLFCASTVVCLFVHASRKHRLHVSFRPSTWVMSLCSVVKEVTSDQPDAERLDTSYPPPVFVIAALTKQISH